jgi:hypothetical protein
MSTSVFPISDRTQVRQGALCLHIFKQPGLSENFCSKKSNICLRLFFPKLSFVAERKIEHRSAEGRAAPSLKDLVNRELFSRKSRTVYQRSISQNYVIPAMTFHARMLIPEPVFPKEK